MDDYDFEKDITLIQVQGRTYRKAKTTPPPRDTEEDLDDEQPKDLKKRQRNTTALEGTRERDEEALKLDIKHEGGTNYSFRMKVPRAFYGFLIGKGGQVKAKIERETSTQITIPRQDSTNQEIVISTIDGEACIVSAKSRIDIILQSARERMDYTHFLSIPLPFLAPKMREFSREVLAEFGGKAKGLDESILIQPETLHITLGMLKLYSDEEIKRARELVGEAFPRVYDLLATRSLLASFHSLQIMNDDPTAVHVLYLKVHADERLTAVAQHLTQLFGDAGLIPPEERDLKLHVTLINTRHRQTQTGPADEQRRGRDSRREPFDASGILAKFAEIDFGKHRLEGIHLSERGKYGPDGYYHCLASIAFP
jgi:activating signal cointegrator complex subunit 1